MGTTDPYGLPYPDPADRARSGSVAIRALAERVRDLLTPSYAVSTAAGSPADQTVTGATNATFGSIDAGTADLTLEAGVTLRYSGAARWFLVDVEATAIAGAGALDEAVMRLIRNGAETVATASIAGAGSDTTLRISTPVRLENFDGLQVSIAGNGSAATFGNRQFRVASISPAGAP